MDFRKQIVSIVLKFSYIAQATYLQEHKHNYSQYKHHNTYISDRWGGRTSDKYITMNSSLLSYHVQGDLILTQYFWQWKLQDYNFVTINVPEFT